MRRALLVLALLSYEQIAQVCSGAVATLPDGAVIPPDSLVAVVAGVQEGVEPDPVTREERVIRAVIEALLWEGLD